MKQLLTSAGFAAMLLLAACSSDYKPNNIISQKADEPKQIDYDSKCIVGQRYTIFGLKLDKNNPFEEQPKADVIITAKQNGYVQYCWSWDVNKPDRTLFTRSCREFVESMNCR